MSDGNGRTHEPSLREITVQLDGLDRLYEERDRRYEDRFKAQELAVAAALAAQEKLTAAAFAASKEAILKAEASQTGVREMLDRLQKEINALRESRSEVSGRDNQQRESWHTNQWAISMGIAFAGLCVSAAYVLTHLPWLR